MRYVYSAIAAILMSLAVSSSGFSADAKPHRVAIQVNANDPAVMNLALNNATNIMEDYKAKGETVEIQIVTYGPGLNMLRDDTSPVKDRLKQIRDASFPSKIAYAACNNTKQGMEKREGKTITIVPEAELVPSGAVTLIELQEKGWSYLKP
ncbi:MAG: DsrE family protein [Rhizobiales bacterium]|nr:DsrE family protein [Hyphomicrobiales bacterium]